jgi:hypothetical protein
MASKALSRWQTIRRNELDQLLSAHKKIGGDGPGRRYATEQLNFAYLVAVAAQFQGFCRDLHSEAAGAFVKGLPPDISTILLVTLTKNRRLDQGNANDGTIAEDFGRLGMEGFWDLVASEGGKKHTARRLKRVRQMNMWPNAIAHNNFEQYQSSVDELDGRLRPRLVEGKKCRVACETLATQIEAAVAKFLHHVVASAPW